MFIWTRSDERARSSPIFTSYTHRSTRTFTQTHTHTHRHIGGTARCRSPHAVARTALNALWVSLIEVVKKSTSLTLVRSSSLLCALGSGRDYCGFCFCPPNETRVLTQNINTRNQHRPAKSCPLRRTQHMCVKSPFNTRTHTHNKTTFNFRNVIYSEQAAHT